MKERDSVELDNRGQSIELDGIQGLTQISLAGGEGWMRPRAHQIEVGETKEGRELGEM